MSERISLQQWATASANDKWVPFAAAEPELEHVTHVSGGTTCGPFGAPSSAVLPFVLLERSGARDAREWTASPCRRLEMMSPAPRTFTWPATMSRLRSPRLSPDSPLPDADDAALVVRMKHGDRSALASLYERHAGRLLALAQSILRSHQEAEDLIHDVFLEAWRRSAEYSEERGTMRTWLLLRTRSRALDRLKSSGRRLSVADSALEISDRAAHASSDSGDQARLHELLSRMPEAQRQVILLGYFEGLTTAEIALRLGIPAGTVKSRTRAALSALRSVLVQSDD